jgi:23S rRNA (uracil1939-C5)-methyltransferase
MNQAPDTSNPADALVPRARGDTAVAAVESLTHDARGVARIDGKTTFIEGALPGERVRFRYYNKRPRFDNGATIEVLDPSPDRVTPGCRYYGVCGGCSLQHLAAGAQLLAKQRILAETLEHVGRVQPARWLPPIASGETAYRRHARLGVRLVAKKGGVLVGFRERRRSFITPLENCLTLEPRLAALLVPLREVVSKLSCADRLPQVEVSAGDSGCAAVFRHLVPLNASDIEYLRAFARAHDVTTYLQPGGTETIHPLWPRPAPELEYSLPEFDVRLAFAPADFIQVNGAVNGALVSQAVAMLELTPRDRVLDLFCGLGNFTLPLARRAGHVLGLESESGLVARAQANAARNGITNAEFGVANLYDTAGLDLLTGERWTKLLLDPPRAGAIEVMKALSNDGPAHIVYVSCNPATLARDSDYLVHVLGYRLEAAGVADMFPHTSHVESIALYTRQ